MFLPGAGLAHTDSPGSPPVVPLAVQLQHRQSVDIVALFAREQRPDSTNPHVPRAARLDTAESLVPPGLDAILRNPDPGQVILVGAEARFAEVQECIQVLDVPVETTGPDRQRVTVTLRRGDAARVRDLVLRYPDAGSAIMTGKRLMLDGTAAWLHRALRQIIRAELKQPPAHGNLSR
jgi:hypothetical protein